MTDLNLTSLTDLEIVQLTAEPEVIQQDIFGGCNTFETENGVFEIGLESGGDFCLENSVLEVIGQEDVIVGDPAVYDISVVATDTTKLLKRALKTPFTYITMYIVQGRNINITDQLYGNNIYSELSEGLTLNFIARAKQHTLDAINRANLSAEVRDVEVNIAGPHTVDILVTYRNNFEPTVIEINV